MENKENLNFIEPDIQWVCWYIRYKNIWWALLALVIIILVGSVAIGTKAYIQYQDIVEKQKEAISHHIDAKEAHSVYDSMVHEKTKEEPLPQGTLKECIYVLDASNTYHIQLVEWSTMNQWYVEARGSSETELHQFSSVLSRLGGHRHYDEVVEKESGTALYRSRITATMESLTNPQKKSTSSR
ncbi:hypothetical protein [Veillonella sp. CHU594]|jgi:hypothetical protein|uniref:hypothetical protein n=1 Tax=Veillonella sp. CHU594 TaxID=2490948 RepID=UPI000F8CEE87|nr:hypothetical protein [Veillonella sp. CHU594]